MALAAASPLCGPAWLGKVSGRLPAPCRCGCRSGGTIIGVKIHRFAIRSEWILTGPWRRARDQLRIQRPIRSWLREWETESPGMETCICFLNQFHLFSTNTSSNRVHTGKIEKICWRSNTAEWDDVSSCSSSACCTTMRWLAHLSALFFKKKKKKKTAASCGS